MSNYEFHTLTGKIKIDHSKCLQCTTKICIDVCEPKVYMLQDGKPILRMTAEEVKKGGCIECLACELDCRLKGNGGLIIELPTEEL
jgi:NAD-dependent dihydropyrimidine dehydrogenase PreA subunit